MKKVILEISFLFTSFFLVSHTLAAVVFDDGGTHVIDYSINDNVFIGGSDTYVEIREGAYIVWLTPEGEPFLTQGVMVGETAEVSMSGGYSYALQCSGDSIAVVSGGNTESLLMYGSRFDFQGGSTVSPLYIGGNCQAILSGGNMNQLETYNNSHVNFSGGTINSLFTNENSLISFDGSNFEIDGIPVGYGDSARDYAVPDIVYEEHCLVGNLTGTLQDGQLLNVPFRIYDDSDIVFVPEPTTLLLLSLGGLLIRKRK